MSLTDQETEYVSCCPTQVFCCRCMKVTPNTTHRNYDRFWWICNVCGAETDEEFIDHEDDRTC